MKLLIDQNLSSRLPALLRGIFDNCVHVKDVGLSTADDLVIWSYAKSNDLIIVSRDSDFHHLSLVHGFPPKVIWLDCGNRTTDEFLEILKSTADSISEFAADEGASNLIISR